MNGENCDILFVGGGLANTLAAVRLLTLRPDIDLRIVERGATLGGRHTWSFHETDLTPAQHHWVAPFVAHRWPRQEVRFPAYVRILDIGYRTITSEQLHAVASRLLGDRIVRNATVSGLGPGGVRLDDGRAFQARAVIDGRGQVSAVISLAWQKFVGREIRTLRPHGVRYPVIMDATVEQRDGYRFVYLLPFAPDRLLIEDTYYSEATGLDDAALSRRIGAYVAAHGWEIADIIREERGILPIALGGDIEAFWAEGEPAIARTGLAAALFHPTTGYSLPDAVRFAEALAAAPILRGPVLARLAREHSIRLWRRRGVFRFLNRMLFHAAAPAERWRLLERFYRMPEGLVGRFYADRLTFADRARLFTGRPPVPVLRAIACLADRSPTGPSGRP